MNRKVLSFRAPRFSALRARAAMALIAMLCVAGGAQAQSQLNEGFEGTTFPPGDWTTIHVSGSNAWVQSTGTGTGAGSSSAYACRKDVGGGYDDYLITPLLEPQSGEELSFYLASQYAAKYSNTTLTIEVSTTTPTVDAFTTTLATYTSGENGTFGTSGSSDWVEKTVDISAYVGQQIYIAFHAKDTGYNADVRIDNVSGVSLYVSAYPKPTNLAVTTDGQTATVTWDGTAANGFIVTVNNGNPTTVQNNSYTFNVDLSTSYEVTVKADYGDNGISDPATISFTTPDCIGGHTIEYVLNDSYGDGWNGNAINIIDACGNVETLTIDDGNTNSGTLSLCGDYYQFVWQTGSYPGETSFTLIDNGVTLYSGQGGSSLNNGQELHTIGTNNMLPRPTDLAAGTPEACQVELSWTENGEATAWEICIYGDEGNLIAANSNPFTLDQLTPGTNYSVMVRATDGTYESCWSDVVSFTTPDAFPAPTAVAANNVTVTTADISWTGNDDAMSYNLRYAINTNFSDDFENGLGQWTVVRNGEGDGSTDWHVVNSNTLFSNEAIPAHSGNYVVMTRSYNGSSAVNVDNWLISPQVNLGGTMTYWVRDDSQYHEHYDIYVSTTTTDLSAFTKVYEPGNASGEWTEVTVDLSAYAGQQGYVAFRNTDYDQDFLFIDDVTITAPSTTIDWMTVNNATNPYTITGLTPETKYNVEVQAVYEGGSSKWTSATFTTLAGDVAPFNLQTADVTTTTATLNWEGIQDSYNVRYRSALAIDPSAPATIILNYPVAVWTDGSGYQMLLDADATAFSTIIPDPATWTNWGYISTDGTDSESKGDVDASVYAEFEYKIPANADGALSTANIVNVGNSVSIQIPAGTYDWCITNPGVDDRMWIASSNGNVGGRQDDYVFEAGKTYELTISAYGNGDGIDVAITRPMSDWTKVNDIADTSYELTGLTPGTEYEWQVQGIYNSKPTEWSEIATFTTDERLDLANDATDNSTIIADNAGKVANVKLVGRTLFKDGNWNTICLPFDVDLTDEKCPLYGATAKTLTEATVTGDHVSMTFGAELSELEAGVPYIIKWDEAEENIEEPEFTGVTIKETGKDENIISLAEDKVQFIGYFDALEITAENDDTYYMTADNTLKRTGKDRTLKACRAYFLFTVGVEARSFTLNFGNGVTTGISLVENEVKGNDAIYDLQGRRVVNTNKKGLFVKNGQVVIK